MVVFMRYSLTFLVHCCIFHYKKIYNNLKKITLHIDRSHVHQRKERQCHPSNDVTTNHKVVGYHVSFIICYMQLWNRNVANVARIGIAILLTISTVQQKKTVVKTNNNTNYIGKLPKSHHYHVYHVVNVPAGCYHVLHSATASMKLVPAPHPSFWD